jgi:hypothetical protein
MAMKKLKKAEMLRRGQVRGGSLRFVFVWGARHPGGVSASEVSRCLGVLPKLGPASAQLNPRFRSDRAAGNERVEWA